MTFGLAAILNGIIVSSLVMLAGLVGVPARSPRLRVAVLRCCLTVVLLVPATAILAEFWPGIVAETLFTAAAPNPLRAMATSGAHALWQVRDAPASGGGLPSVFGPLPDWVLLSGGAVWLVGAICVFARYLASLAFLSRTFAAAENLSIASRATASGLQRALSAAQTIEIRMADNVPSPCAFGIWRPRILLPRRLSEHGETLNAILAHELCHIRNGDVAWLAVSSVVCSLCWFNPLVWLAARVHRSAFELVCDDDATDSAVEVDDYVSAMLDAARGVGRTAACAGVMMSAQGLVSRARALIERERALPKISRVARIAMAAASMLFLVIATLTRVVSAEAAPQQLALAAAKPAAEYVQSVHSPAIRLRPGEALLYVDAGTGITVGATSMRFKCSEASCQFTVPAGRVLTLNAEAETAVTWNGCAPSDEDGRLCSLVVHGRSARVTAARADH